MFKNSLQKLNDYVHTHYVCVKAIGQLNTGLPLGDTLYLNVQETRCAYLEKFNTKHTIILHTKLRRIFVF